MSVTHPTLTSFSERRPSQRRLCALTTARLCCLTTRGRQRSRTRRLGLADLLSGYLRSCGSPADDFQVLKDGERRQVLGPLLDHQKACKGQSDIVKCFLGYWHILGLICYANSTRSGRSVRRLSLAGLPQRNWPNRAFQLPVISLTVRKYSSLAGSMGGIL